MEQQRRNRPPVPPLDPHAVRVYKRLADEFGNKYAEEFLYPHLRRVLLCETEDLFEIQQKLESPRGALVAFYCHYAFARRGKDREMLASFAYEALDRLQGDKQFEELLTMEDGVELWENFEAICQENRRKANEPQNRGLLQGMLELAQEIYREDGVGSITQWMFDELKSTGHIEPQFERIVDIRGVGPKSTSTFMRDLIYTFDLESKVEPADRIYIHPIDRWLRMISRYIVPEPNMEKTADWIIAGKLSKYSRRAGVSGVGFNMGTTYFGQKVIRDPSRFEDYLKMLVKGDSFDEDEPEENGGDEQPPSDD